MPLDSNFYQHAIDLSDTNLVESELKKVLEYPIHSVEDLKTWLHMEKELGDKISEVYGGHSVDFFRDTESEQKRRVFLRDQSDILPLVQRYEDQFNHKFFDCPFTSRLDDETYGMMKRVRNTELELFREANLPLQVKERELVTEYQALIGGLTAEWEGQQIPLPAITAKLDDPDRSVRERAWRSESAAYHSIKGRVDAIMDELVKLRHTIATNAGFANYRDYMFRSNNREYTLEACQALHTAVEQHVVPVWDEVAKGFRQSLGVDAYRPWDNTNCTLSKAPYSEIGELEDGVGQILATLDSDFGDLFNRMLEQGLLDLGGRKGKRDGGFMYPFPVSKHAFVFANMDPSYFSLIALIHEMGHATNYAYQFQRNSLWTNHRMEVAELYSHGMELLCIDKVNRFYTEPSDFREAVRQRIRRSLRMLMGPLSMDLFQHWVYEHPEHTSKERDEMYYQIQKRYSSHPVDYDGLEAELAEGWAASAHIVVSPFYSVEYSMAELGALQLLENYRDNPATALAGYKRGAAADYMTATIEEVYRQTGVSFDLSDDRVAKTAAFVRDWWARV